MYTEEELKTSSTYNEVWRRADSQNGLMICLQDLDGHRTAALVLVVDPENRPRIDPARVASMLGPTPSEGRVAALLAEGRPVREIAATAGFSESYVRFLLKQAYRKQGLSGQVALVRRVLAVHGFPSR